MAIIKTNEPEIENELNDEIRLFFPYDDCPETVEHSCKTEGDVVRNSVKIGDKTYEFSATIAGKDGSAGLERKRLFKRACKKAVYDALADFTKINPPWGSLTGIRPSKLVYDMLAERVDLNDCPRELEKTFGVSGKKANLICDIVKNQRGYYRRDQREFNLYIHIPFCTSKCRYCSFTTETVARCKNLIPEYVRLLRRDIEETVAFIEANGNLLSVYVGGGTPTALSADDLTFLLDGLGGYGVEFTVEAGRPDTITAEKLDAIKRAGATRICVNPQTFNDETLKKIGRAHTRADFLEKYELARGYGFDINVDLIAGLEDETLDDFSASLNGTIGLAPQNITVHTLSRKNGSELKQSGRFDNREIEKMTDFAFGRLTESGYVPYYLYRQKQMLGNLENVGYCLAGKQCLNNVTTMEDCTSVLACGAGAIEKAVDISRNRIERFANMRDVRLYIANFEEKMSAKRNFRLKQFTKA